MDETGPAQPPSGPPGQPQPAQVFCPNCRGGNPPGAMNCMWCGTPLAATPQPQQQPPPQYHYPPQHQAQYPPQTAPQARPEQPSQYAPHYPPQQPAPAPATSKGGVSPVLWVLGGLLVLILACAGSFYLFVVRPAEQFVSQVGEELDDFATGLEATSTALAVEFGSGFESLLTPGPTPVPIERTLDTATPRTFTYANANFTVVRGVITNKLSDDPPLYLPDSASLDLELSVTNPTGGSISLYNGLLKVRLADGTQVQEQFNQGVAPRDTGEYEFSFQVPVTATWEGAVLSLDELEKEPATIPLSGEMPQPNYPATLPAGAEATTTEPPITFTIKDAALDLDASNSRAELGKRFLIFTVVASSKTTALVGSDSFRLVIDGTPQAADSITPVAEVVSLDADKEFVVAFQVPATATKVELAVGDVNGETKTIPFDLAAAQP
jgi:hypothetical protein